MISIKYFLVNSHDVYPLVTSLEMRAKLLLLRRASAAKQTSFAETRWLMYVSDHLLRVLDLSSVAFSERNGIPRITATMCRCNQQE